MVKNLTGKEQEMKYFKEQIKKRFHLMSEQSRYTIHINKDDIIRVLPKGSFEIIEIQLDRLVDATGVFNEDINSAFDSLYNMCARAGMEHYVGSYIDTYLKIMDEYIHNIRLPLLTNEVIDLINDIDQYIDRYSRGTAVRKYSPEYLEQKKNKALYGIMDSIAINMIVIDYATRKCRSKIRKDVEKLKLQASREN